LKPNPNPQRGPATALAQLLAENPALPPIRWALDADGHLSGSAMCLAVDARPVMAAYAAVLGGTPDEHWHAQPGKAPSFSSWLFTTWRDVPVSVTVGCSAELAPAVAA
jgi:hypothetical protein